MTHLFRFIMNIKILLTIVSIPIMAGEKGPTLSPGETAPPLDFSLYTDGPSAPNWGDLKGNVVVLDFWATWCGPCIQTFPHLNTLVDTFEDQPVKFFSVTYETRAMIQKFLKKHELKTSIGLDRDFSTFKKYFAWGIPMVVIVDGKGKVVAVINPSSLKAEHLRAILSGKIPEFEPHPGWPDPKGAEEFFRSQLQ